LLPDPRFCNQSPEFWANVRMVGQLCGYSDKKTKAIRGADAALIQDKFRINGISCEHFLTLDNQFHGWGVLLASYLHYRAEVLTHTVQGLLMNREEAKKYFEQLRKNHTNCPLPLNKQKGDKRHHAYFTCIINLLLEANIRQMTCDYSPTELTSLTLDERLQYTFSRRFDGAFPSTRNPIAIWEIKEYYGTKTFGSRVADGVYETQLDGLEILQSKSQTAHILFVDDHYTWWTLGRSYLCRMIDMLHMGLVDEIVFGREVLTRVPQLAQSWADMAKTPECGR
jgi:hypothetical protein